MSAVPSFLLRRLLWAGVFLLCINGVTASVLAPPSTSAPDDGTLTGLALPDFDDNAWHAWDYTNSTDPVDAVLVDDNHTYAEWSTEGGKKEWERWAPANYDRKCVRIGGKEFNEFIHVYSRDWGNGGGKNCMKGFLDNLGAECKCIVAQFECGEVNRGGGKGVWARFYMPFHPTIGRGAVERAFLIASNYEYVAQPLKCCNKGDNACFESAPGYTGHTNLTDPVPPPKLPVSPPNGVDTLGDGMDLSEDVHDVMEEQ